jgi:glycosyltransferase involved in cell wall biosynthesis
MIKKVALIHDWLNGMRGGEKVLEVLLDIFPNADIFTLFLNKDKISDKIKSHKIFTSSLNRCKFVRNYYRYFLPLLPTAIEEFNLEDYDLIISNSHCVAKGIVPFPGSVHISYIFTPMRYVWDQYFIYFGKIFGIKKFIIKHQISKLRIWDVTSSSRVDNFIAISNFVKERIWKYYRRESCVIHPPVDIDFFKPSKNPKKKYFLTVSALVPYKNTRLLIETFNETGQKLIIVGKGPEEKKLKRIASKNIEFKKDVTNEELKSLYQNAKAFIFAGIEDFGISFVEAQSCGIPVIAYKKGGVVDIVEKGKTGVLFENQSIDDIKNAINELERLKIDPLYIRKNSLRFSEQIFKDNLKTFIKKVL